MSRTKLLSNALVVQLFLSILFIGLAAAAPPQNIPGVGPKFVPEELIVKFKTGVSDREINAINVNYGTSVRSKNRIAHFMILQIHGSDQDVRKLVKKYRENKKVEYAEPNYIVHHTSQIPNDPDFSLLWGLYNDGQTQGIPGADISMPEAWDIQTGNDSVVVAVIDTGVDYNHQDLSANIWHNPGEIADNGIDDDGNGFIDDVLGWNFTDNNNDPFDDNSHGTHVAGTIAAVGDNGLGVAGVNWTARIMPLKFLDAQGNGPVSEAIQAIQYASMMGARIINNSWGGSSFSKALKDAITAADTAGSLFVVAAGNNGTNNDMLPFYPASYDVPNIITVAATDHNDELADFSNYGPSSVDLGAPGVDIFSTAPGDTYKYMEGTSMATPHVSGVAALLLAEFPSLTHNEVKEQLLNAVDPVDSLKGMTSTGGRLDAGSALLGVFPPELPDPIIIFEDNIESGMNDWTISGETPLWHQSYNRFVSPSTSWYYGIEDVFNYNTGTKNHGSLTTPPIDLTDITDSELTFEHFLDTEADSYFDKALVKISDDGGTTFTDVFTRLTTNGDFVQENLNIAAFDGKIIQIQFSFDTVDSLYNNFEGWYLDNVKVLGQVGEPTPNIAPTANAGPDQTANDDNGDGNASVTLNGSGSFDPDGVIVTYEWQEGQTVLGTTPSITASFTAGSHTVTLTVTDEDGATGTDEVLVTVNPNQPPVAEAGPDQTVADTDGSNSETVTLTAAGSADPDGIIATFEWREGLTLLGNTASISIDLGVGVHPITLTVTDNGGATASDTVLVTVNTPPATGPTIRITNIDVSLLSRGRNYNVRAQISILDDSDKPAQGTVTAEWWLNGVFIKQVSKETDKKGVVNLEYGKVSTQPGDTFLITIIDVSKEGFTYDLRGNAETSDSVIVP